MEFDTYSTLGYGAEIMWLLGRQAGEFGGTVYSKLNKVLHKHYIAISKLDVKKEARIEMFVGFPLIFISKSQQILYVHGFSDAGRLSK